MSPLLVGAAFGDVQSYRGAVGNVLDRVAGVLNDQRLNGATIQLVFVFPGELTRPDWKGLRIGRVDGHDRSIVVSIAVPDGEVDERQLLALARSAMESAIKRLEAAGVPVEQAEVEKVISSAQAALGLRDRATSAPQPIVSEVDEASDDAIITVTMPLTEEGRAADTEIERLQVLELALDAELRSARLGEVDGNELGRGEYTLIIFTPHHHASEVIDRIKRDPRLPPGTDVRAR